MPFRPRSFLVTVGATVSIGMMGTGAVILQGTFFNASALPRAIGRSVPLALNLKREAIPALGSAPAAVRQLGSSSGSVAAAGDITAAVSSDRRSLALVSPTRRNGADDAGARSPADALRAIDGEGDSGQRSTATDRGRAIITISGSQGSLVVKPVSGSIPEVAPTGAKGTPVSGSSVSPSAGITAAGRGPEPIFDVVQPVVVDPVSPEPEMTPADQVVPEPEVTPPPMQVEPDPVVTDPEPDPSEQTDPAPPPSDQ